MRRGPLTLTTCAAVVGAALLGGCSSAPSDAPAPAVDLDSVNGLDLNPVLDAATGAVTLPYDRFVESYEEMDVISVASSTLISACAAKSGVRFPAPTLTADTAPYVSELYFGPWTTAQASRFGFVRPMSDADLVANGIVADDGTAADEEEPAQDVGELSEADYAVMGACSSAPEVAQLNTALMHDGPWVTQIEAASGKVLDQPAAKAAIEELGRCYDDAGLEPDSANPWMVAGARGDAITEEQIALALKVVACKDEVDFTARMARVEAQLQAPVIAEYTDELVAQRRALDEAVAKGREILAGAPQAGTSR